MCSLGWDSSTLTGESLLNHLKVSVPCIPFVVKSLVLSHMTDSQMENE